MDETQNRLEKVGIAIPEILLSRAELKKWAVVACDQFTQDREYWMKVAEAAIGSPSSLDLIFPEVFLDEGNRAGRIEDIHKAMRSYLDRGVFGASRRGFVYLERDTPFNRGRKGLVAAVDLERYSWSPAERPLIRSTEGTVTERLPPRMAIRRNAPIETPHILLLIDDETNSLLQGLGERVRKADPVYQGELMLDSGSISGWFIDSEDDFAFLADRFEELALRALTRYEVPASQPASVTQAFLFAVGDGNHSLSSAKEVWEEYKKANGNASAHPCRYALVEIENIYDPAVKFEPIHRVVFGLGFEEALDIFSALPGFSSRIIGGFDELVRLTREPVKGNRFGLVCKNAVGQNRYALVETIAGGLSTACLQPLLDNAVISSNGALTTDYIHGEDELFRLAHNPEKSAAAVAGILLPPVQKAGFFETIARNGPLPRKSFSMGEACEKRFYIECRKLFG
jgi:hypothetical protein